MFLTCTPAPDAEAEKAPEAAAAAPEEWAQFGEEGEATGAAAAAAAAAEQAPAKAAAPSLPAITEKDVKDSLQLTEVWRAEVAGGAVVRAGVEGGVRRRLAPYGLAAARFQVLPAHAGVVNACLRVAAMNRDFAEQLGSGSGPAAPAADGAAAGAAAQGAAAAASGSSREAAAGAAEDGGFLAKFTQASVGCCYLQYT